LSLRLLRFQAIAKVITDGVPLIGAEFQPFIP
jgi:hypothetical protein